MNQQQLPSYPEHPEPDRYVAGAEYEKETRPRTSPWTMVFFGLTAFACIYVAQKYLAEWVNSRPVKPVATRGN
ncbi:MAG: hypothetical protein U0796_02400 [Gemmatales bacterium]